jgi:hypothetical protein
MPTAVDHAEAALERLTLADIAALPPARRSRFRELLRHWHMLAEGPKPEHPPKAGVLAQLRKEDGR